MISTRLVSFINMTVLHLIFKNSVNAKSKSAASRRQIEFQEETLNIKTTLPSWENENETFHAMMAHV